MLLWTSLSLGGVRYSCTTVSRHVCDTSFASLLHEDTRRFYFVLIFVGLILPLGFIISGSAKCCISPAAARPAPHKPTSLIHSQLPISRLLHLTRRKHRRHLLGRRWPPVTRNRTPWIPKVPREVRGVTTDTHPNFSFHHAALHTYVQSWDSTRHFARSCLKYGSGSQLIHFSSVPRTFAQLQSKAKFWSNRSGKA